jgi:hypothetical protein
MLSLQVLTRVHKKSRRTFTEYRCPAYLFVFLITLTEEFPFIIIFRLTCLVSTVKAYHVYTVPQFALYAGIERYNKSCQRTKNNAFTFQICVHHLCSISLLENEWKSIRTNCFNAMCLRVNLQSDLGLFSTLLPCQTLYSNFQATKYH